MIIIIVLIKIIFILLDATRREYYRFSSCVHLFSNILGFLGMKD